VIWNCRVCGRAFEPKPYQVKWHDRRCTVCYRELCRRRRARPDVRLAVQEYGLRPDVARRAQASSEAHRRAPENAAKYEAHKRVTAAIRSGRLKKQPCERCGNSRVHAHHDDYSRPLEVRWLCPACHGLEHRKADLTVAMGGER
jgi:ribosomal protein S27AE